MSIKSEKDWNYRQVTRENTIERQTVEWVAGGERKSGMYADRMDPSDPRSNYSASAGKNRNLNGDQF